MFAGSPGFPPPHTISSWPVHTIMSPPRGARGVWEITRQVSVPGSNASPCQRAWSVPTPKKIASPPVQAACAYFPGSGDGGILVQDVVAGSNA